MLRGYKTYLGALGLALLALYHFANGDPDQGWARLMEALSLAGLRHALTG